MSVRITFLLKGVSIDSLLDKYKSGSVDHSHINTKISVNEYKDPTVKVFNQDVSQPSFCRKDKTGNTINYRTTGNKVSPLCFWCRAELKDKYVGLPISICSDEKELSFYTDGFFCDNKYSCAYAFYQLYSKDSLYSDTSFLLKYIFNLEYDNQVLRPAPDWRLHERNGGCLKDEEFNSDNGSKIVRSCNFIPVRVEYRVCEKK